MGITIIHNHRFDHILQSIHWRVFFMSIIVTVLIVNAYYMVKSIFKMIIGCTAYKFIIIAEPAV